MILTIISDQVKHNVFLVSVRCSHQSRRWSPGPMTFSLLSQPSVVFPVCPSLTTGIPQLACLKYASTHSSSRRRRKTLRCPCFSFLWSHLFFSLPFLFPVMSLVLFRLISLDPTLLLLRFPILPWCFFPFSCLFHSPVDYVSSRI